MSNRIFFFYFLDSRNAREDIEDTTEEDDLAFKLLNFEDIVTRMKDFPKEDENVFEMFD